MMSSRKEEERNEKVIRGLMKLPPNRKCINCNSLGPQYVCTNFWTFVCINCSGIHREFTHRVKSVSMAKFTSPEVEALQKGGNQRAREVFLKDWDLQRQRLPDSSNVDKVREFIKHVYVEKKYAGGKSSDKPPRDMQSLRNNEDDLRRASSYHSYSQSPPYEHQYEERKYGKQGGVLSRKPGSDHGRYEGKVPSFICSPGRSVERMYEDRFANETSGPRFSDYSVSSSGDPFRSGTQSPNFQENFSNPPRHPGRNVIVEDAQHQRRNSYSEVNARRSAGVAAYAQRTASLGSIGSFDSNSLSLNSVNSGGLVDIVPESEQSVGFQLDKTASISLQQPLDLFNFPLEQLPTSTAASMDLSMPLEALPPKNLFKAPETSSGPTVDLFAEVTHQETIKEMLEHKTHQASSATPLDHKSLGVPFSENEGWATFDLPQRVSAHEVKVANPASASPTDLASSINSSMQWPSAGFIAHGPLSPATANNQWHQNLHETQTSPGVLNSEQPWNAFGDSLGGISQTSFSDLPPKSEPQATAHKPPSDTALCLTSDAPEVVMPYNASDRKSINPFDLPYDTDPEPSNAFLDMSALQAALPNSQLPPGFGGVTEPWFPQNAASPYIQADAQGGLAYMAGEAPNSRLQNIPSQGPLASLGGNPFA
ncbi:hypothetical protein Syun_017886 [Stephania yunnanensis]|uniref:Arf-GAP domain-containing protein n=1 Tax=Stephania yunnanensis TaxID=152371 RepID=A0AAP0J7Q9_9MAGN